MSDPVHVVVHAAVTAVESALTANGVAPRTRWFDESTATAVEAANALGVELGAIVKSLLFMLDDRLILVLASGAHRVDTELLGRELGGTLSRASASAVKQRTGQSIGGVAPIGHPEPIRTIVDVTLADYDEVWASAGHPRAVFPTHFDELLRLTGGIPGRVVDGPGGGDD